jgi:hypothetical protein
MPQKMNFKYCWVLVLSSILVSNLFLKHDNFQKLTIVFYMKWIYFIIKIAYD